MLFFNFLYKQYPVKSMLILFWVLVHSVIQIYLVTAFSDFFPASISGKPATMAIESLTFVFLSLLTAMFLIQKHYYKESAQLSQNGIYHLRMQIINKIDESSLLDLENVDRHKMLTRLGTELDTANNYMIWAIQVVSGLLTLVIGNIFLMNISLLLPIILNIILFPLFVYHNFYVYKKSKKLTGDLDQSRSLYAKALGNILKGLKDIKINYFKQMKVLEVHQQRLHTTSQLQKQMGQILTNNQMYFNYAIAAVAILSILLGFAPKEDLFNVLIMVLFLEAATFRVIFGVEGLFNINTAINNIYLLKKELKVEEADNKVKKTPVSVKKMPFKKVIKFKDITFNYGKESNFGIGPINLTLKKGEVVFISGENGSGKSTLLKTITGLYPKTSGSIEVDGVPITAVNMKKYQELFTVVFSDFHLFKELYGQENVNAKWVHDLLELLNLSHKTSFKNNQFTNINLSTGQRKRLAILTSLLEKKEIYIFDEAAADQDTEQKNFFYDVVLQELKKANKTVIVVSHDGPYTDAADRIMKIKRTETGSVLKG